MPPEKGKESKKGRNGIKESQKGRKRKGPGSLQSQLETIFLFISEKTKVFFLPFSGLSSLPYRAPVAHTYVGLVRS